MSSQLILYTKQNCHLCEGLQEKLGKIKELNFELEIRDIGTRKDWFNLYQYEVPVLSMKIPTGEKIIPRPSPRISVEQLQRILQKYLEND
jgi:hypothetical protein